MLVAIHQPNFIPWYPYFEKMAIADKFVIMSACQFEKGGYQNRCNVNGKWWTVPVRSRTESIDIKKLTNGDSLMDLNWEWIEVLKRTLDIDTELCHDWETGSKGSTRLVELVKDVGGTHYLTNPEAFNKYLSRDKIESEGIKVIEHKCEHKKHIFEMFHEFGIEGTKKIIKGAVKRHELENNVHVHA